MKNNCRIALCVLALLPSLCPGDDAELNLGLAASTDQVRPMEAKLADYPLPATVGLRLARGETESVQLLVSPEGDGALRDVTVTAEGDFDGLAVSVSAVCYVNAKTRTWFEQGYCVPTNEAPGYVRVKKPTELGWYADALPPFVTKTDVKPGVVQSFWVSVKCPATARPGVRTGSLVVTASNARPRRLPFAVTVNRFAIPAEAPMKMAVVFHPKVWSDPAKLPPEEVARRKKWLTDPDAPYNAWKRHEMEWGEFLADHYVTMTSLYHLKDRLPHLEVLKRLKAEGRLGEFSLGYWSEVNGDDDAAVEAWKKSHLPRLRGCYEDAKAAGIADKAFLYGCDEMDAKLAKRASRAAQILKAEFPGVPIMTTAYDYNCGTDVPPVFEGIDWYVPVTQKFDMDIASRSRALGHQVWWYFACSVRTPWANLFVESQPIEARQVMGAMALRMKPDGYLYYMLTTWNAERPIAADSSTFLDWTPVSWDGFDGDGTWVYVGLDGTPVSSIRFENFRDGLEDLWYGKLLEKRLAAQPDAEWAETARQLLKVPRKLFDTMTNFSDDPKVLYRWREAMADILDKTEAAK